MRIWSIHPKYLDSKGLVALWRETLLAKHVLEGKTKGYKNHPQLIRFKACENPLQAINQYLGVVYTEANKRGYNFDSTKFNNDFNEQHIHVNDEQVTYEKNHLLNKLKIRDLKKYKEVHDIAFDVHPLFKIVKGAIEDWEIT